MSDLAGAPSGELSDEGLNTHCWATAGLWREEQNEVKEGGKRAHLRNT